MYLYTCSWNQMQVCKRITRSGSHHISHGHSIGQMVCNSIKIIRIKLQQKILYMFSEKLFTALDPQMIKNRKVQLHQHIKKRAKHQSQTDSNKEAVKGLREQVRPPQRDRQRSCSNSSTRRHQGGPLNWTQAREREVTGEEIDSEEKGESRGRRPRPYPLVHAREAE